MGRYITDSETYYDNELMMLRLGLAKNRQEFKTVGADTWTLDHDALVRIRLWGGGGGGYTQTETGASAWTNRGNGGGAGGHGEIILNLVSGTYNIVVGAGGTGRRDSYAVNGGSSSFGSYITAQGGCSGYMVKSDLMISGSGGFVNVSSEAISSALYIFTVKGGDSSISGGETPNSLGDTAGRSGQYGTSFSTGGGGYASSCSYGNIRGGAGTGSGSLGGGGYGGGGGAGAGNGAISGDGAQGIVIIEWN